MGSDTTEILTLDLQGWSPSVPAATQDAAVRAIEGGGVVVLPRVSFEFRDDERRFLSPQWSDGRAKNVSLDGTRLKGAQADLAALAAMVARFAQGAASLVSALFPRYAPYVKRARTS
ncbi:MAG: Kdo hydroxylase family protein, partial [Burkholderiales bacterium]|nr:Kdo hydroxylase family protein [Burkholderiales bacterium]